MWTSLRLWLVSGELRARPYPLPTKTVGVSADLAAAANAGRDLDYSTAPLRNLYVGGAGNVYVKRPDDASFTKYVVPAGGRVFGLISAIGNSGSNLTTATDLVGEY